MTTISVAMATFQGERFLDEQLQSIAAQSVIPSECVIADDGSTDRTLELVRGFAEHAPFPVVLIEGVGQRLGASQNLSRALERTTGDLVFLADQDDVWEQSKVERLRHGFDDPAVLAVFTDALVIDAQGAPTGRTLWDATGIGGWDRRRLHRNDPFRVLLRCNPASGASMCVRRSLLRVALPMPPQVIHDYWLALQAAIRGGLAVIEDQPLRYREHAANVVGPNVGSRIGRWMQRRDRTPTWTERGVFVEFTARVDAEGLGTPAQRALLVKKLAHLDLREYLPRRRLRRVVPCLAALGRGDYHRFARGLESFGLDLVRASSA